ncbi:hypothetical protein BDV27DRAFT_107517 [Aspergillus caelatus]|uniref:Uncharacterized protein n=1 Tax=Aspergillus caelatus TaxID=61420 RepID=A0A5N7A687_9EURO|nr:uncharacterized protein BDV27DRAFT_107517 [Aspergillus caelatus]KAE8365113.1 hypothetical protein BDV27DRAFT_107517 [Aspergillus caelatus]
MDIHDGGTVHSPSAHILPLSAPRGGRRGARTCSSARIRNLATTVVFASLLVGGERASPGCTSYRTTKQVHVILGTQTTWYHISSCSVD